MRYVIVSAVVAVAALAGCAGPDLVKAPNTAARDPLPIEAYPEIVLLDGLERALVKERPIVTPSAINSPLRIRVPIRSVVDQNITIQYRTMFYGADREELSRDPAWKQRVVQARTQIFIDEMALTERAQSWRMEIRTAR
jgi:uncharacterized protein YcfL